MTHQGSGECRFYGVWPACASSSPAAPPSSTRSSAPATPTANHVYRLGERQNDAPQQVHFGKAEVIRQGALATVAADGPLLTATLAATKGLDVTVLYYTTVAPFDGETLRAQSPHGRVVLVEPFYADTLIPEVTAAMGSIPVRVAAIRVPHQLLTRYGTPEQYDEALGLTSEGIRADSNASWRSDTRYGDSP